MKHWISSKSADKLLFQFDAISEFQLVFTPNFNYLHFERIMNEQHDDVFLLFHNRRCPLYAQLACSAGELTEECQTFSRGTALSWIRLRIFYPCHKSIIDTIIIIVHNQLVCAVLNEGIIVFWVMFISFFFCCFCFSIWKKKTYKKNN